jgi:hypothetical protein
MAEFRTFNLGDAVNQGQNMAMNNFRLGEAARGVQARQGLSQALQTGTPEAMDQYSKQFPQESGQYQEQKSQTRKSQLEQKLFEFSVVEKLMSGVQDQPSLSRAVQMAQEAGLDTSKLPQEWNEQTAAFLEQNKLQALGVKGQMEMALRDLGKSDLVEIYDDKSPTGTRFVKASEAVGKPGKMPSGLNIEFDEQGRPKSISQGRGGSGGMGKAAQNTVEKEILEHGDQMSAMKTIQNLYRPEFQQIGTKWNATLTAIQNKAGVDVDPRDRKQLEEFSKYRAEAAQAFSMTLKRLSGVAVNPTEFKRTEAWMPNPGTGIFDGDSPIELEAKRQRMEDFTRRALIKYNYIRKNGLSKDDIDVDDMPAIVQKRGDELATRLAQRYKGDELKRAVKSALSDEFGFGIVK